MAYRRVALRLRSGNIKTFSTGTKYVSIVLAHEHTSNRIHSYTEFRRDLFCAPGTTRNLDIVGWMGYPMQIKINFLCRDSILAAPLLLDLARFLDLAKRAGMSGIQEWLSFYFKSPMTASGLYPEHDLFIQQMKLKNTLHWMMGEMVITHLGMDYYQDT